MARRVVFLVSLVLGTLAPLAADAQRPEKVARIGLLSPFSPSAAAAWHEACRGGLRDLGWMEGQNISIEYRYAEGRNDRLADLAADLVRLKVVGSGLVESLARPGGNITGLSQIAPELAGKRLALLKEIVPEPSRVAVIWSPRGTTSPLTWKEIQLPARELGLQLHSLEVRSVSGLDKAFEDASKARAGALAILPDPLFARSSSW